MHQERPTQAAYISTLVYGSQAHTKKDLTPRAYQHSDQALFVTLWNVKLEVKALDTIKTYVGNRIQ